MASRHTATSPPNSQGQMTRARWVRDSPTSSVSHLNSSTYSPKLKTPEITTCGLYSIWSVIFLRTMADKGAGFAPPPPSNADLPPSYNESQSGVGAGGFHVPQQQQQPQTHPQQQQPPVIIQYQQAVPFGPDPQEVTCPLCQSRIRTTVDREPGVMAWIIAGILCFTG